MRSIGVIFITLLILLAVPPRIPAAAQVSLVPRYEIVVEAGTSEGLVFKPDKIIIPAVPIILNVTVFHNGSAAQGLHTFSISDSTGVVRVDAWVRNPGEVNYTEFAVNSTREIFVNGQRYQMEQLGGGIKFFCDPHEDLGMVGSIVIGTEARAPPELGLFLRAYWIGLIGLGAMLAWIGITYFIIKRSSRRFTDHREHLRRGLP